MCYPGLRQTERMMSDFLSTTNGKVINVSQIAFLTSRTNPNSLRRGSTAEGKSSVYRVKGVFPVQLVVAFSAMAEGKSGMLPLSIVLEGAEALDFLGQLEQRGIDVVALRKKIDIPAPDRDEAISGET